MSLRVLGVPASSRPRRGRNATKAFVVRVPNARSAIHGAQRQFTRACPQFTPLAAIHPFLPTPRRAYRAAGISRPKDISRAKHISRRLRQFPRSYCRSARHIIGACATSFDRLRSTSLTKSHHCCAATHHCAKRTFLAQRTIPFLASRTERQSLPRFCKIPLKKRLKTLRNKIKPRLFVFARFSSFRRFAQLFSLVLVCSADFVRRRPILPCFFARYVV